MTWHVADLAQHHNRHTVTVSPTRTLLAHRAANQSVLRVSGWPVSSLQPWPSVRVPWP